MAVLLDDASSQYLRLTTAPLLPTWNTFSLWFYPDDLSIDTVLFSQHNTLGTHYRKLIVLGTAGDKLSWEVSNGVFLDSLISTGTATANAWNHALVEYDQYYSPAQWRLSLNGAAFDSMAQGGGVTVTATRLGAGLSGSYFSGRIAEFALWSDVLHTPGGVADDAYTALSKGFTAFDIHRELLTQYWPLFNLGPSSNPHCLITRQAWNVQGGPSVADHCRRIERVCRIGVS